MSARDEQRHQALLAALGQVIETSTALAARIAAFKPAVNGVLEVGTYAISTAGNITRSYGVPIGSVVVSNPGANSVIVASGSPGTSAPTVGRGIYVIPPFAVASVPIAGHAFTCYGTAADVVGIQVFTGLQPYGVTV